MIKQISCIIVTLQFSLLLFSSCYSRESPKLELSVENYDFGNIKKDSIYKGNVIITNTGNASLIIDNINPGCGCTSVNISKDTIQSNDTCLLTFSYKTYHKKGHQEIFINIMANTDSIVHTLQVSSFVE